MHEREAVVQIQQLARPLVTTTDLDDLVADAARRRIVAIGEASHGTHEYYAWRAELSQRLIEEHHFTWIGVEGDWPDCWQLNQWVRGAIQPDRSAVQMLNGFERWPTWMWANREIADFLDWLRDWNTSQPPHEHVGFYGLDVYSLWESLAEIMNWLRTSAPTALPAALEAWKCFLPYDGDPQRYAWATRLVPEDCEDEVVELLLAVREEALRLRASSDETFAVLQNAEVVTAAEQYYRAMMHGDQGSWNVRDLHMTDTVDRIVAHEHRGGREGKGVVWAHNTHVGDARGTDMARAGMWNLGELLRRRHSEDAVHLIGFGSYSGTVVAADGWGEPDRFMAVPEAPPTSHEGLLHAALGQPAVLRFGRHRIGPWLEAQRGHRAIGVVYHPAREAGNFVPTIMADRYDALIWCERTNALSPLHREPRPSEAELETEPTGF